MGVISSDAQKKSHRNKGHTSGNCNKRIVAEVVTDDEGSTAGHVQNKCNKEQLAPLNIKHLEKVFTSVQHIDYRALTCLGRVNGTACTCEQNEQQLWKSSVAKNREFELSFEEPKSPLTEEEEPDWLVDMEPLSDWEYYNAVDPATRD